MIDNEERKLCCEQRQEPLRCIHVGCKAEVHEMIRQVRQLLLHASASVSVNKADDTKDVKTVTTAYNSLACNGYHY